MTDLPAVSICAYLTSREVSKRSQDWPGIWMTKAIKGDEMAANRYFDININGTQRRFDRSNIQEFRRQVPGILLRAIAPRVTGKATLVPVPNSHVTAVDTPNFRTLQLAEAIANISDGQFSALPALVFKRPMDSARKGEGSRNPYALLDMLDLTARPKNQVVLINDVRTTGGHIKACAWRLLDEGAAVVLAATFSRTTHEHEDKPLGAFDDTISISRMSSLFSAADF